MEATPSLFGGLQFVQKGVIQTQVVRAFRHLISMRKRAKLQRAKGNVSQRVTEDSVLISFAHLLT